MNANEVIERTRQWIARVVIGLNLCPFARRVFEAGLIRYTVTETQDVDELLGGLGREIDWLAAQPRSAVETTLFIHPNALVPLMASSRENFGLNGYVAAAPG